MTMFQGSPLGYRNSQSDCPASPNSPCSPHSFSPAQSPGVPAGGGGPGVVVGGAGAPFTSDTSYYMHQPAQTNALPHQFEQFNLVSE